MLEISEQLFVTNKKNQENLLTLSILFADNLTEFFSEIGTFISLISSQFSDLVVEYPQKIVERDVILTEVLESLHSQHIFRLFLTHNVSLQFLWSQNTLKFQFPFTPSGPYELKWMQVQENHGKVCQFALPMGPESFHKDACHGIIHFFRKCMDSASLKSASDIEILNWSLSPVSKDALPIIQIEPLPLWLCGTTDDIDETPTVWADFLSSETKFSPDSNWLKTLEQALLSPHENRLEIQKHLNQLLPFHSEWEWVQGTAPGCKWMSPPPTKIEMTINAQKGPICVYLDPGDHSPQELKSFLLHALAHIALGHIRPLDDHGHWDTLDTVENQNRHRLWDQQANECVGKWLAGHQRQVANLEECTSQEKAMLGVWRMIGEMLGDSRQLHKTAEQYQKAAYQRQAAQRLVATLEEFGGGMLCDGVGLGKTYVATTVIVHFANTWKEKHQHQPEVLLASPFRITVLAPNSVVSTWEREAIPPLVHYGVPLANLRVMSHSKLSRISTNSEVLQLKQEGLSDLEHLLLSDLVIVDEAHNFRSLSARRTKVLRDLLRLQPRKDLRRKVLLLTATPINNSLDDLRQEVSLLFCKGIPLDETSTPETYYKNAVKAIQTRCNRARGKRSRSKEKNLDLAALIIHGNEKSKFSDAIEFRDDLQFGPQLIHLDRYLKQENERLKQRQESIRDATQTGQPLLSDEQPRIAEELLDRIVVQRSRQLCKEIELQQDSQVDLLFRPDASSPQKLYYSDEYDGIEDVLARFLPLFDAVRGLDAPPDQRPLSLKIYMWYDVKEGIKEAKEVSSVVGLQRVLVLKRLESSPVSFLITLLRLAVLHAYRLDELIHLCAEDTDKYHLLHAELEQILKSQDTEHLKQIRLLATGNSAEHPEQGFIKSLSLAYSQAKPSVRSAAMDRADQPLSLLSSLLEHELDGELLVKRDQLDRLWVLRESLLADFETLLTVIPALADIIFGRFSTEEWPRRFIDGGEQVDWPRSASWGLRMITDAKLRRLIGHLIEARRDSKKVIIFSQFNDTIAYIQSVLRASRSFKRNEWQMVLRGGLDVANLKEEEVKSLWEVTATVTGKDSDKKDDLVNAFAPYYRIGPIPPEGYDEIYPPHAGEARQTSDSPSALGALFGKELDPLHLSWRLAWQEAMQRPLDIVFSTDVLAEGVNLQDAALMVNFDVHWNPVRMIQRAGRIDRRLNPAIENGRDFPALKALAHELGVEVPAYYWHTHPNEAPQTVNMILPDELEAELQLREKITTKTLAIDFTLGLEQGTGAEADWMENYKYQGISSLNSYQKDRAIEQIAGYHEKFARLFKDIGIQTDWSQNMNVWLQAQAVGFGSPLIGRSSIGYAGGQMERFSRYLEPLLHEGVPYWYWAEKRPGESIFDGWLIMDGKKENYPPQPNNTLPAHDDVSTPLKAHHLLGAAMALMQAQDIAELDKAKIGRPLLQGISALAAPKFGDSNARKRLGFQDLFLLQLPSFEPEFWMASALEDAAIIPRKGASRSCKTCGAPPGMHKCCPQCELSAEGESQIEVVFGFRTMKNSGGASYAIAQPWCRQCRTQSLKENNSSSASN